MKIAIIGAGNVGASLGRSLGAKGHDIRYGVRNPEKIAELIAASGGKAQAADPAAAAAFGEVVFLTVPWPAVFSAVESLGDLEGKILADCTNPIVWDDGPVPAPDVAGTSGAKLIAARTRAQVVKAFSTHGWEINEKPRAGDIVSDAYVCGDDARARATVASLASDIGFHVVDVGPLRNAALLEHLAVLWVHMAVKGGAGRNFTFNLVRR